MNPNENLSPEELRAQQEASAKMLTKAKEEAHLPIPAPTIWFTLAGIEVNLANKETPLNPFGAGQKFACTRLGFFTTGSLESACMLTYLCIVDRRDIDAARGEQAVADFRAGMEAWADAIGVTWGEGNEVNARIKAIASEIMLREEASASKPDIKGAKGTASPNG